MFPEHVSPEHQGHPRTLSRSTEVKDHGRTLSQPVHAFIDPSLLSLGKEHIVNTGVWTTPYPSSVHENIDSNSPCAEPNSYLPLGRGDEGVSAINLPSFNSTQNGWENESAVQEQLNDFSLDPITLLNQNPTTPSFDFLCPLSTQWMSPDSPTFCSTPSPSNGQDAKEASSSSTTANSASPSSASEIACTWPTCTKSFLSRASYKYAFPRP